MSAIEAKQVLNVMITYGLFVILTPRGYYITRIECIEIIETSD